MDGSVHEAVLPIPHKDQIIPFRAKAISSFDEFHKLCPEPNAPSVLTKDGKKQNFDDPSYKDMVATYMSRRAAWMVVESLQDIEWETVDPDQPGTWIKWEEDLRNAGFSQVVINRIASHVLEVNALDESKLEEARKSFALGQAALADESSGLTIAPGTTPSGEPAAE